MPQSRHRKLPRSTLLTVLTAAALAETVWTIYIGWRLPRHYVANHWDLAWVGLDVAQVIMLLLAAWAAWKRRALLISFAIASATLLVIDAWFDVTTARRGDVIQSLLMAFLLEIPLAVILLWVSQRAIRAVTSQIFEGTPVRRVILPRGPKPPPSDT